MTRRILVTLFAIGLVGVLWAARPMITAARAQTAATLRLRSPVH